MYLIFLTGKGKSICKRDLKTFDLENINWKAHIF